MVNVDVSEEIVTPLRDPAGDLLVLDEMVDDVDENEDTDEDLVLSDDDDVDDNLCNPINILLSNIFLVVYLYKNNINNFNYKLKIKF